MLPRKCFSIIYGDLELMLEQFEDLLYISQDAQDIVLYILPIHVLCTFKCLFKSTKINTLIQMPTNMNEIILFLP